MTIRDSELSSPADSNSAAVGQPAIPKELCADDAHDFGPCKACGMPYLASQLEPPTQDDIDWAQGELAELRADFEKFIDARNVSPEVMAIVLPWLHERTKPASRPAETPMISARPLKNPNDLPRTYPVGQPALRALIELWRWRVRVEMDPIVANTYRICVDELAAVLAVKDTREQTKEDR